MGVFFVILGQIDTPKSPIDEISHSGKFQVICVLILVNWADHNSEDILFSYISSESWKKNVTSLYNVLETWK